MHLAWIRSTRDMFIRDVRRSGRWCPERGCMVEHQIFRFPKKILRDRCSTWYDLASLAALHTDQMEKSQNALVQGLHSTFHVWRKSRRIALFLMLSPSKIEDVSQNWFVFWTLSNSKNWGSLVELLRYWCCQVQKLRKSSAELQLQLQLHYTTLH